MKALENWLLNIFLGKLVARATVTLAGYLAAGPVHSALASAGINLSIDPALLATFTIGASHAGFEWLKAKRLAVTAPPAVTPKP